MTHENVPEVRVREVRARDDDFVETAVQLAGGFARLGLGLLKVPLSLLPRETQQHTLNALRELSYAFATLPRDFAEIAGQEIEKWVRGEETPLLGRPSASFRAVDLHATPIVIETEPAPMPPSSGTPPPATLRQAGLGGTSADIAASVTNGVSITYIEFDPPGHDVDGEYVRIKNESGAPVDLSGWTLRDSGPHVYTFPAFVLAPGAELRLWTKSGTNDAANLYWGDQSAIWNNAGDTALLFNAAGVQVSSYTYVGKARK